MLVEPTGAIAFAPAGHPPPIVLTADECRPLEPVVAGPLLGVFDEAEWPVTHAELTPGATLMLYTDGLIEARPEAGGERLGVDGLAGWTLGDDGRPDAGVLVQAVRRLADSSPGGLEDDIALVVVDADSIDAGVRAAAPPRSIEHA
jgi:sigma-B regulation protein RsbU (phosphoserine phosphatase)